MSDKLQYITVGDEVIPFPEDMTDAEIELAIQQDDPLYQQYKETFLDIPGVQNIPSFADYAQQVETVKADEERRANRGIGEKALGVGEAGLSTGSALLSAIASPFVYGGESLVDVVKGRPVESFETRFPQLMQEGTYQPRTEVGQEYAKDVGDFVRESKIEGAIGIPVLGRLSNIGVGTAVKELGKDLGSQVGKVLPKPKPKTTPKSERGVTSQIIGGTTGAGDAPLRIAYETGKQGLKKEVDAFRKGIEGNISPQNLVQRANSALALIRKQVNLEYQKSKAKLSQDRSVLDFDDIDQALKDVKSEFEFQGKVKSKSATKMINNLEKEINKWKKYDKKKFHTPEGFDALKQLIGEEFDNTAPGSRERLVVDRIYTSMGETIRKNAPIYDEMMKDYATGKDTIKQIQDTLSLKEGKSVDTQFRKLSSVLRNNVNTNFGERAVLAERLNKLDPTLFPELAGQSLTDVFPRGIQKAVGSANIGLQGANIGANVLGGGINPLFTIPSLLAQSPRLMGETAFQLGRGARGVQNIKQQIGNVIKTPEMPSLIGTGSSQAVTDPLGLLGISER
jgi:6-pyruvoyl-tetrahydropterin synthase